MLVHPVFGPLRSHGAAVQLAGEADREIANVDHLLNLTDPFRQDLSHLQGDQGPESLDVVAQGVSEATDVLGALVRRKQLPTLEGLDRVGYDLVVISD